MEWYSVVVRKVLSERPNFTKLAFSFILPRQVWLSSGHFKMVLIYCLWPRAKGLDL
jgi:hypothetical protein